MAIETLWLQCLSALHFHGASDMHIQPFINESEVWLRINGRCSYHLTLEKKTHQRLLNYIKSLAGLSIVHHLKPQEGLLIDPRGTLRVSFCPVYAGERVTIRWHYKRPQFTLTDMGWTESDQQEWVRFIECHSGLHLITGPTGAGKTTTLYGMLSALVSKGLNIITIEDPIEQPIKGINQIEKKSVPLEQWVKVMLRQDPDIMVIGELRDGPMLSIASQLSVTGHSVLASMHAGTPQEVTTRLGFRRIPFFLKSICEVRLSFDAQQKMKHRVHYYTSSDRLYRVRQKARESLDYWDD